MSQEKYKYVRIGLASPEQIRDWAEKILPTGEIVGRVSQSGTFHYGSDEPERDGIFCERIFGPTRSGLCACGKYRDMEDGEDSRFCKDCGVEYVESRVRRYRMGYIELACAVTHIWYLKSVPGYIANILSRPPQELESLAYCDLFFARPVIGKPTILGLKRGLIRYDEYGTWNETVLCFFHCSEYDEFADREVTTGGDAIRELLANLDLKVILDSAYAEWEFWVSNRPAGDEVTDRAVRRGKDFLLRHVRLVKNFVRTNTNPGWMVISSLPVLPPELRPMVQLSGGRMIGSDINELYRRIVFRNNSLGNLLARRIFAPEGVVVCQKKLLQGAVDALLGNGIGSDPMTDTDDRPFKSFSDMIQGKEGRFRENLLGKRVDYSGRSVIVAGPCLRIHQCELPRGIAMELFQPFMIRSLIKRGLAPGVEAARALIGKKTPFVWEILRGVMRGHTILLNRAPTLHRLGIQAFEPILADGCAIRLHPLVCAGFNADFDGDQMAVHVPLSLGAQAEARLLVLSHMSLLSPATGDPVSAPNQDMLLGLYILTIGGRSGTRGNRNDPSQRSSAYAPITGKHQELPLLENEEEAPPETEAREVLGLQRPLWLRWPFGDLRVMNYVEQEEPIESQYEPGGTFHQVYEHFKIGGSRYEKMSSVYIRTTAGRLIFNKRAESSLRSVLEDFSLRDAECSPQV
uniref:DNA-directed RNA polymerase subunit beta' n=1 Tax=Selaginella lyallii TaxID=137159 RepID=A0A481ZNL6_9TRAC|nr:RNA polymerase beta [Selaginella lyallii]QBL02068.1 RNA polymerase beta [Selaginella lyallii]